MKEKDSELVRLIRENGGSLWPLRGERRILKFALDAFGEPLSRFLLSGLSEEEESRIWLFSVPFTGDKGSSHRRDIRVEADGPSDVVTLLPRRREPLVMLGLLWLLIDRKLISSSIFYDQKEVLELLGWEDTPASRLSIDETVERYADISYRWTLSKEELAEKNIAREIGCARLIVGYGYMDIEEQEGRVIRRSTSRIDFATEFINELMNRSLFGINWNNVSSLKRSSHLGGARAI